MKTMPIVASALLAVLTSCQFRSYGFAPRQGELPDVQTLEAARQSEVKRGNDGGLGNVYWFPLLVFQAEIYNRTDAVGAPSVMGSWPAGTTYADYDAFGPLSMFTDSEACYYDEEQKLFERNYDSQYFWGLYQSERSDVRVATGWRVDMENRILFGLFRWSNKAYVSSLPYDRRNSDG